ncbi:hypothetical protein GCM10009550_11010 [Actinocorallia libanotica]|uniref:Uncharacterized protein n=1 Tax=Actinocorallia libanotica TaxID=46162 RepID=A0ABN1QDH9_9ACTN
MSARSAAFSTPFATADAAVPAVSAVRLRTVAVAVPAVDAARARGLAAARPPVPPAARAPFRADVLADVRADVPAVLLPPPPLLVVLLVALAIRLAPRVFLSGPLPRVRTQQPTIFGRP